MRIYNNTGVVVSVAPTATPVSVQDALDYLKLDDTCETPFITMLIEAATQQVESYLKRKICTQTLQAAYDYVPAANASFYDSNYYRNFPDSRANKNCFFLPFPAIQSITSIKLYDTANTESTYDSSNYYLDSFNGRCVFNQGAVIDTDLRECNAMIVTYVAGYATVPATIKMGILEQVKMMYECRGVCDLCDKTSNALAPYKLFDTLGY